MGFPAARIGDMTVHGGVIVGGHPTVLIGGMPAARLLDFHTCPMMTPAGPAPIPHVGGIISMGSSGVLIGGLPAARANDMAICVGPPDMIALGCLTVLIGEVGGGGGGGGGAGFGMPASVAAHASAATALSDNTEATTKEEHWLEMKFVDKASKPVSGIKYKITDPENKESESILRPDGSIKRDATKEGQAQATLMNVINAKWSKDKAEVGEKVKMSADVEGFENGTKATVQVYKRDISGPDVVIDTIETEVKSNKIEWEWEYKMPEISEEEMKEKDEQLRYSAPEYYFESLIEDCKSRSGLLGLKDWIEIKLKDHDGNAVGNKKYTIFLPNGEIREGKLDSGGYAKVEDIPPGKVQIKVDPRQ